MTSRSGLVLAGLALALIIGCGDDSSDDGGEDSGDDAGLCPGASAPPSGGCELVVASAAACPSLDDVCAGVCGAAFDCCYCDDDEWRTLFIDCPPCPDARP